VGHRHDYPPVTEREWCTFILAEASRLGLLGHWNPDSRRAEGNQGYPDITLAGGYGVLFAEVKLTGASTSAGQDMWAWQLDRVMSPSVRYALWNVPDDWDSGRIQQEMRDLSS
jgi:hypothetical protein